MYNLYPVSLLNALIYQTTATKLNRIAGKHHVVENFIAFFRI